MENGRELFIKRLTADVAPANLAAQQLVTNYSFIAGVRDTGATLGGEKVDTTVRSHVTPSLPIVESMEPGMSKREFSVSGLLLINAATKAMILDSVNRTPWWYYFNVPGIGVFTGLYAVDINVKGPMKDKVEFDGTLYIADGSTHDFVAAV